MNFNKPTGCGNTLNFIQSNTYICEKMDTDGFDFHTTVTLNKGQGHPNWYQNVESLVVSIIIPSKKIGL